MNLIKPRTWFRSETATKVATTNSLMAKAKRMFAAALPNRLTNGWQLLPEPPNYVVRASLRQLRARSREGFQNNPYIKRFVDILTANVIGHRGILCHPTVKLPNGELDDVVNALISGKWIDWGQDRFCDVSKTMSWTDMQRMVVKTLAVDGEVFIRKYRSNQFGKYGFALQLIDPEFIDVMYDRQLPNGNYILQGIEFNKYNAPVAYHIYQPVPNDSYMTYAPAGSGKYLRVPASEMLHIFLPFEIDARRGIPMTATSLFSLKMLDGYMEAAVVAARVGASTMGFFKTVGGEEVTVADAQNQDGSLSMDAEPGSFRQLPNGVSFDTFKPDYPQAAFMNFVKTALRQIACGLGISYTSLSNDIESVNYSSIRQDALQDRELFQVLIDTVINLFIRPVYQGWLEAQLMIGTFKLPKGKTLFIDEMERYAPVRFAPRAFPSIDPQKDTNSHTLQILNGFRSRSDVIRHDLGQDPENVFTEIASENKRLAELGLNFNVPPANVKEDLRENL